MGEKKKLQFSEYSKRTVRFGKICAWGSLLCQSAFYARQFPLHGLSHCTYFPGGVAPSDIGRSLSGVVLGGNDAGEALRQAFLLSVAGSVICHDCAFRALCDLRMRILSHMGKTEPGLFHRWAVRRSAEDHERQHREDGGHYRPRRIQPCRRRAAAGFAGRDALFYQCAIDAHHFAALAVAFCHSVFGFRRKTRAENLDGAQPIRNRTGCGLFRICGRHGGGKNLRQAGSGGPTPHRLIEKNRSHLMAYLKRVTPIYGAYKTITLSVLAFILITGCVSAVPESRKSPANDGTFDVSHRGAKLLSAR